LYEQVTLVKGPGSGCLRVIPMVRMDLLAVGQYLQHAAVRDATASDKLLWNASEMASGSR